MLAVRSLARVATRVPVAALSTRYAPSHEWISVDGDVATVGITDYAQNSLGDVVFVDLPGVGDSFAKGDAFGVVESVKAVSDVYAPVGGSVVEVNEELEDTPNLINESPTVDGWMMKIQLDDAAELDELMDQAAYDKHLEESDH